MPVAPPRHVSTPGWLRAFHAHPAPMLVSFSIPYCPVLHTMAYVRAEARVGAEPGAQVWVDGRAAPVTIHISLEQLLGVSYYTETGDKGYRRSWLAGWILPLLPFTDGEAAPEKQSHQSGTAGHGTVGVASQPSSSPRGCATHAPPGELWEF